jgi:hypothetical protein
MEFVQLLPRVFKELFEFFDTLPERFRRVFDALLTSRNAHLIFSAMTGLSGLALVAEPFSAVGAEHFEADFKGRH